jgi:hypothetical protein
MNRQKCGDILLKTIKKIGKVLENKYDFWTKYPLSFFLECSLSMNFYKIIIIVDYALVSKDLTVMVCREAILTLFQYWPNGDLKVIPNSYPSTY